MSFSLSEEQNWRRRRRHLLVSVLAATLAVTLLSWENTGSAQTESSSDLPDQVVIFVIDLSGSMNEPFDDERSKLEVAKEAFVEAFTNVSPNASVGLRVYGDQLAAQAPAQREQNCTQDSRLVVPISQADRDALIAEVQAFEAVGDTPIGLALRQANDDIPEGTIGTVVLFSDGRDECFDADLDGDPAIGPSWGEDPCVVARDIAGEGVDLRIDRVETVGFRADEAAESELRCIADSTGGSYTPIESPEDARELLPELLAQISSPREAERLGGVPIDGTTSQDSAPAFSVLDPANPEDGRYTDTIEMNSEKWYQFAEYGPGEGTFTATAFGLPAQEGISFTMRLYLPSEDRTFFDGRGDDNAGTPRRPTASIRCPGCSITGGPHEVFWILSLQTENPSLGGTYDLELLTEGPAFGGVSTSCAEPQECWYEQEIEERTVVLEELRAEYEARVEEEVPQELIDQRDTLLDEVEALETTSADAQVKSDELEAEAAQLGDGDSDLLLPLMLGGIGLLLAVIAFVARRQRTAAVVEAGSSEASQAAVIGHVSHEEATEILDEDQTASDAEEPEAKEAGPNESESQTTPAEDLVPDSPTIPAQDTHPEAPTPPTEELEVDPDAPVADEAEGSFSELEKPEPGWYADPDGNKPLRWWDGEAWTDNYRDESDGS